MFLLIDGPLLVTNKPAGIATQTIPGLPSLEAAVKQYLRVEGDKTGQVYLGVPHRLDRPVSGVVVFAKNSKTAARLAEQFRDRTVQKTYWALVQGLPPESGHLVDTIRKIPDQPQAELLPPDHPEGKRAELTFKRLAVFQSATTATPAPHILPAPNNARVPFDFCLLPFDLPASAGAPFSLLEVTLLTGRMHQIRIQLGSRGWPILNDTLYGGPALPPDMLPPLPDLDYGVVTHELDPARGLPITLHARTLQLKHPIRYDDLTLTAPLPPWWPLPKTFPTAT